MLRYWLSGDLVEHRAHVAADVSLQVGGQADVGLSPLRRAWFAGGALLNCSVHFFAYARRFLPAVLLACIAVHNRSPVRLLKRTQDTGFSDSRALKTSKLFNWFQLLEPESRQAS
jgi:hypothetical protein